MRCIDALRGGDEVGRAALAADLGDGLVDQPVGGREEKIRVQTGDLIDQLRVGEKTAEYGTLGGGRLWDGAFHLGVASMVVVIA